MKKYLFVILVAFVAIGGLFAEGGTLYLYRTNSLPVQDYHVVANQTQIGTIAREQAIAIRTESNFVLLHIDNALARSTVMNYMVYRYFVDTGSDVYVEIVGSDFRIIESSDEKRVIRQINPIMEVDVP